MSIKSGIFSLHLSNLYNNYMKSALYPQNRVDCGRAYRGRRVDNLVTRLASPTVALSSTFQFHSFACFQKMDYWRDYFPERVHTLQLSSNMLQATIFLCLVIRNWNINGFECSSLNYISEWTEWRRVRLYVRGIHNTSNNLTYQTHESLKTSCYL